MSTPTVNSTRLSRSISEMLVMQNTLNLATNGDKWRDGVTGLGKKINWRRCIVMEAAELVDSYPWKHWKSVDAPIDMDNARVELVDIWHFLLSLAIEVFDLDASEKLLATALTHAKNKPIVQRNLTAIEQVVAHETMMRIALENTEVTETYLSRLTTSFFNACQVVGLDFDQLHQIYMAKNVLNKFRQDHGYKEGTYIKEWNGKEDNAVMFDIIEKMTPFSGDELYGELKQAYQAI